MNIFARRQSAASLDRGEISRPAARRTATVSGRRLVVRASAALLVAYLVGFHALLLWQRILDLTLFEPLPALRWLATAALLWGLYRLRRQGVSLVRGRRAQILWLLVLLLHVSLSIPVADDAALAGQRAGTGLWLALPAASLVLALGWLLVEARASLAPCQRAPLAASFRLHRGALSTYALRAGELPSIASRPPPAD